MFDQPLHGVTGSWLQRARWWFHVDPVSPGWAPARRPPADALTASAPPTGATAATPATPRFAIRQRLARRLVLLIVLASSCITLLITGVQLAMEYRHLRSSIDHSFDRIEPFVPGITKQLWELNVEHLQLSAQALGSQSNLKRIRVRDHAGVVLAEAAEGQASHNMLRRVFDLRHEVQGANRSIGTLEVYASLDDVYDKLLHDAVVMLLSNFLKTLLMVVIMLAVLQKYVASRLGVVVRNIGGMVKDRWPEAQSRGAIKPVFDDEVDMLDHVAKFAHDEIQSLVAQLRSLNDALQGQLADQQNHLRTMSMLEEVVVELDARRHIVKASDGWQRFLPGVGDILGKDIASLLLREEDTARLLDIVRSFDGGEEGVQTLRFLFSDNVRQHAWIEFRVLPRHDLLGQVVGYVGVLQDVTKNQDFDITIAHMALHDPLTSLPNRSLLGDRLKIALKSCRNKQQRLALVSVDIDNFKSVNDAHGHKAGDKLLIEFSKRLKAHAHGDETVARWGGDEFTLLLPHVASTTDLAARVENLHQCLKRDYGLMDEHITLTTSVGVALYPDDGATPDDLMLAAEQAKGVAKSQGRNQIMWAEELRGRQEQRHHARVRQRLMKAVERGDIEAWMQPIVRSGTRECDMVEVLARWHDEELGWVSPAVFIPLAEEAGIVHDLGHAIWEQAVARLGRWRARGMDIKASINVSSRQLYRQDFTAQLLASLAVHGVPPAALVLEITESVALLDVDDASQRLAELSQAGFQLALDDFGTGYASLSQLHDMPLRELKIDISFVRRIHTPIGASMIDTIIKIAEVMGLDTIAEGVESCDIADALERLGVTRLQGYCFGRPMAAADFERWYAEHRPLQAAAPSA